MNAGTPGATQNVNIGPPISDPLHPQNAVPQTPPNAPVFDPWASAARQQGQQMPNAAHQTPPNGQPQNYTPGPSQNFVGREWNLSDKKI